jgi:hypothetical protein
VRRGSSQTEASSSRWPERCSSAETRDSARLMGNAREALAGLQKLKARGAFQAMRLRGEVLGDLVLRLGDELGGGGGRGGAQVGDEVGDGEVGFMADGGDDGQPLDAIARATRSLLKAARSSSEPPPRASTIRSTRFEALSSASAASISAGADRPARRPGRAGRSGRSGGG